MIEWTNSTEFNLDRRYSSEKVLSQQKLFDSRWRRWFRLSTDFAPTSEAERVTMKFCLCVKIRFQSIDQGFFVRKVEIWKIKFFRLTRKRNSVLFTRIFDRTKIDFRRESCDFHLFCASLIRTSFFRIPLSVSRLKAESLSDFRIIVGEKKFGVRRSTVVDFFPLNKVRRIANAFRNRTFLMKSFQRRWQITAASRRKISFRTSFFTISNMFLARFLAEKSLRTTTTINRNFFHVDSPFEFFTERKRKLFVFIVNLFPRPDFSSTTTTSSSTAEKYIFNRENWRLDMVFSTSKDRSLNFRSREPPEDLEKSVKETRKTHSICSKRATLFHWTERFRSRWNFTSRYEKSTLNCKLNWDMAMGSEWISRVTVKAKLHRNTTPSIFDGNSQIVDLLRKSIENLDHHNDVDRRVIFHGLLERPFRPIGALLFFVEFCLERQFGHSFQTEKIFIFFFGKSLSKNIGKFDDAFDFRLLKTVFVEKNFQLGEIVRKSVRQFEHRLFVEQMFDQLEHRTIRRSLKIEQNDVFLFFVGWTNRCLK